jgi:hypothetical protein
MLSYQNSNAPAAIVAARQSQHNDGDGKLIQTTDGPAVPVAYGDLTCQET